MKKSGTDICNKKTACYGAWIAVAASFFYSLIVMIYVTIRSSATILQVMPAGERAGILWANGLAMVYSVAVCSLLMAIISSITGAIVAVVLQKSLLQFNQECSAKKAIVISCVLAVLLLTIFYFLLFSLLGERISFQYPETLYFWFVFPAIIYLVISIPFGKAMNKAIKKDLRRSKFYSSYV